MNTTKKVRLLALCILVSIAIIGCNDDLKDIHEAGLRGVITNATSGEPMSATDVYLFSENAIPTDEDFSSVEPYKKVSSDTNGHYQITSIYLGENDSSRFLIGAKSPDGIFRSLDLESVAIEEGRWNEQNITIDSVTTRNFKVKMGQITGVVIDGDRDKKLKNVKVTLVGSRDDEIRYKSSVFTDSIGRYKIYVPYRDCCKKNRASLERPD